MKDFCFLFMMASVHIAQCLIPNLVVKKLDKTLIARKRQDTMDMCRLFTEENRKTQHNHAPQIIKSYIPGRDKIRYKRGVNEEDRRHKRDVNEEGLRYKRGVNEEDRRHKRGVNEESRRYKRGVNEDDLRYKRDVNGEGLIYKRGVNEEDQLYKRGFNEEDRRYKRGVNEESRRYKRGATMKYAVNPALNPEDAKRVENIVDKLYDEMEEKGQRVTYRQVRTTSSFMLNRNKTFQPSRRFDFAPAKLTGPHTLLSNKVVGGDDPFESKARWKHGIVPYYIDFKTYDAHLSEVIMKAFDYVEKATCIRLQKLRERPTDKQSLEKVSWLYISNPTGIRQCVHSNEKRRVNGVVMTVFGYDCMSLGDIVHEVMHILGYSHEHLRSDRDQHISVLWENIKPGYKKYFDLNIAGSEYELERLPYDYSSILHYPPRAFSKNGKVTIMTENGIKIGQRAGLSEIDVEKVALIYSNECVSRNREYLLQTCPRVVKSVTKPISITQKEIDDYFKDRLWPFGIINYKFRDKMEFTVEERENINAVFRHIEQETCIEFRDIGTYGDEDAESSIEKQRAIIAEKDAKAQEQALEEAKNQQQDVTPEPTNEAPEIETTEPDVDKPESEVDNPMTEVDKAEKKAGMLNLDINIETTEPNIDKPETEVDKPESEVDNTETEADKANKKARTLEPDNDNDESLISVGPVALGQASDNDINSYEQKSKKKVAEIIITQPKYPLRQGLRDSDIGTVKDVKENEIDNENALNNEMFGHTSVDFKSMNLTMKKALLKRAKAKKLQSKRNRRDTNNASPRRHANAVLVLNRSPDPGCSCPPPGTPKGDQVLDIEAGCFNSVNDLLHFFVHVLGLDHQHNMHDRDNYLHVVWDNLTPDVRLEMEDKLPPAASVGFSYDYQSVMHYPWLQIKSGKTNIMYPIWNDGWAMGHWQGLSSVDVQKLNLLYFNQCMERQKQENQ